MSVCDSVPLQYKQEGVVHESQNAENTVIATGKAISELTPQIEEVSGTTEELSASMEETAASGEEMSASATEIERAVGSIALKAWSYPKTVLKQFIKIHKKK